MRTHEFDLRQFVFGTQNGFGSIGVAFFLRNPKPNPSADVALFHVVTERPTVVFQHADRVRGLGVSLRGGSLKPAQRFTYVSWSALAKLIGLGETHLRGRIALFCGIEVAVVTLRQSKD